MTKKKMSDAQKYRRANARGAGPEAEGRAKIRAAAKIDKAPAAEKERRGIGESTVYNLRNEGSRLLGQAYGRKVGDVGERGYYSKGGAVKKSRPKGKK
jgi:lipopolysaccharide export system protein LptA